MHHRATYLPPDTPQPRRMRRRIVTGVIALSSVVALTGVTSAIASAHDRPTALPDTTRFAGSWTLPAIERDVPRVVWRGNAHRPYWLLGSKRPGVPPLASAAPGATTAPTDTPSTSTSSTPVASASGTASAAPVTVGTPISLFSSLSPWNTPIPTGAASDPNSSQIVSKVLDNPSLVMNLALYSYGIPFYTATASTPRVVLGGRNPIGAIPIDPSWKPNEGGDQKMNIIDPTTHMVYELQGYDPGAKTVYWAVKRDYTTSLGDGYPADGLAGPTGSGMTQAGGVIRLSEMASGKIDHALSFITSSPIAGFRYPASNSDGSGSGIGVQEGMRIQLDPSLNVAAIPGITKGEIAIAKALQVYGAYCTDNGGGNDMAMGFYAEEPKAGDANPYPAAGFASDWAQLPHIPRNDLRVVAASATPRPN